MRYIGDVHGKMDQYVKLTQDCDASVQVGDFGAGFVDLPQLSGTHRFIRGNHDDPAKCAAHVNWIPDGTHEHDTFYVGGAWSIDQSLRTIGVDWWADEQLTYEVMSDIICEYERVKPDIMITHDCPHELGNFIFGRNSPKSGRNVTNMGLQTMWDIHRPKLWLFGHWHQSVRKTMLGCEFICLAELDHVDI
jgi:predicted phosphohydrolase